MTLFFMSVSAGVLILLILLLRVAAVNLLPKRLFVYLWGIVMLRLLIPFSVPSPFGLAVPVTDFLEGRLVSFGTALPGEDAAAVQFSAEDPDAADSLENRAGSREDEEDSLWKDSRVISSVFRQSTSQGSAAGVDLGSGSQDNPVPAEMYSSIASGLLRRSAGLVWLLGAAGLLLYFALTFIREHRILRQALPMTEDQRRWFSGFVYTDVRESRFCRLMDKTPLMVSDRICSPMVFGILHPEIIVPRDMVSEAEGKSGCSGFSCVMVHELIHIRGKDNLWKMISLLVLCLHWFNPLVWVMYLFFCRDLELSCDESVIHVLGEHQKEKYALALIYLTEYQTGRILSGSGFGKKAVRERVVAIMKYRKRNAAGIGCAVALMVLSMTVFAERSVNETGGMDETEIQSVKEVQAVEEIQSVKEVRAVGEIQSVEAIRAVGEIQSVEAIRSVEKIQNEEEIPEQQEIRINFYQFAEYVNMRLVYDRRNNCLLYEDHPVGYFKDQVGENVYYEGYLDTRNDRGVTGIVVHRDEEGNFLRFKLISMADAVAEAAATDAAEEQEGATVYDMQTVLDWNQAQTSPAEICREVIAECQEFPRCTVVAERDRMGLETPGTLYVRVIDGNEWGEDNADIDVILRVQNEVMRRCWELREVCVVWEYLKNPEAYSSEQRWETHGIIGRTRGTSDSLVM